MSIHVVEMRRSANLTDVECRARLARVYRLLIELGQKAKTADSETLAGEGEVREEGGQWPLKQEAAWRATRRRDRNC